MKKEFIILFTFVVLFFSCKKDNVILPIPIDNVVSNTETICNDGDLDYSQLDGYWHRFGVKFYQKNAKGKYELQYTDTLGWYDTSILPFTDNSLVYDFTSESSGDLYAIKYEFGKDTIVLDGQFDFILDKSSGDFTYFNNNKTRNYHIITLTKNNMIMNEFIKNGVKREYFYIKLHKGLNHYNLNDLKSINYPPNWNISL
jgi:hypothetical protein